MLSFCVYKGKVVKAQGSEVVEAPMPASSFSFSTLRGNVDFHGYFNSIM